MNEIIEIAEHDERIMLLVGDLGFHVVEKFRDKYPERFVNVGIAEQNMAAVAAGLALDNNIVFTYSIGNFAALRGIEQIRNDICYHHANVKILAVGCGFAYGDLGMTHHATEDIAMMRALPYMKVFVPSDSKEAVFCLREAYGTDGPAYIRMARGGEPDLHDKFIEEQMSGFMEIYPMSRVVNIICCGTILSEGYKLRELLLQCGMEAGLFSAPFVNPLDESAICEISRCSKLTVTMEDHTVVGGLGGAVAEAISSIRENHSALLRVGLKRTFTEVVGDQNYLRGYYGMTAQKALPQVMEIINR